MTEIRLIPGDCREYLKTVPEGTFGSVITDPPYELTGAEGSARGFMNKEWDGTGISFDPEFWKLVFRATRSGGILRAFGGTRTYHRMAWAISEAGFKSLTLDAWGYTSGFPKSVNLALRFDKEAGVEGRIVGYKPGVGGERIDDIARGREEVRFTDKAGGSLGAYGTGARQVRVDVPIREPATEDARRWSGWGTGLKPSWEPVVVARKP